MDAVFVGLRALEQVFRLDRRHLWPVALPDCLDVYFASNIALLSLFFLPFGRLDQLLFFFGQLAFGLAQPFFCFLRRRIPCGICTLAEVNFLDQLACTCKCLDMLPGYFYIHNIDEVVNQASIDVDLKLDRTWHREQIYLEDLT